MQVDQVGQVVQAARVATLDLPLVVIHLSNVIRFKMLMETAYRIVLPLSEN